MTTTPSSVPNHQAQYPGYAGAAGFLAAASMVLGGAGNARLAERLSELTAGDMLADIGTSALNRRRHSVWPCTQAVCDRGSRPPRVLYPALGIRLSPIIAAAAMAASSLSVVGNANRLRRYYPAPLPAVEVADVEPQVQAGSAHRHDLAEQDCGQRGHSSPSQGRTGQADDGQAPGATVTDPVCGMLVTPGDRRSAARHRRQRPVLLLRWLRYCSRRRARTLCRHGDSRLLT